MKYYDKSVSRSVRRCSVFLYCIGKKNDVGLYSIEQTRNAFVLFPIRCVGIHGINLGSRYKCIITIIIIIIIYGLNRYNIIISYCCMCTDGRLTFHCRITFLRHILSQSLFYCHCILYKLLCAYRY